MWVCPNTVSLGNDTKSRCYAGSFEMAVFFSKTWLGDCVEVHMYLLFF